MGQTYDRSAQDVGNIAGLEHVNVKIPSQQIATAFYVMGMGFTRDPYLMVGLRNMWINLGQQQFHLPTGGPQVLRGTIGLVVPDLEDLKARLTEVKSALAGTAFDFAVENGYVLVTCPWGNRFRVHAAAPEFPFMKLGMPYVEFPVPRGHAAGIGRFYQECMGAPARVVDEGSGTAARVCFGRGQTLIFRETSAPIADYDGHHVAIYVVNFSGPHDWLAKHDLITEESDPWQYRFDKIVDPKSGELLFQIEHEVRSLTHPMYLRPLCNRNPAQRQRGYIPGRDEFQPPLN
jgi:hypothetical protein